MADLQDEVGSDLSVFHRVDDPEELGASRYFTLARHLPAYEGAVRAALRFQAQQQAPAAPVAPVSGGGQPVALNDVRTVAAMTAGSGFPGVEYVGG